MRNSGDVGRSSLNLSDSLTNDDILLSFHLTRRTPSTYFK